MSDEVDFMRKTFAEKTNSVGDSQIDSTRMKYEILRTYIDLTSLLTPVQRDDEQSVMRTILHFQKS